MQNRVHDTALKVLKEYEHFISVNGSNITVRVKLPEDGNAGGLEVLEVASALRALSGCISVNVGQHDFHAYPVTVKASRAADGPAVMQVAKIMADAGINFPGSARYKTPEKN